MGAASAVALAAAALAAGGCEGRPRGPQPATGTARSIRAEPHVAELDLRRGAAEAGGSGLLGPDPSRSFAQLVLDTRDLRSEPNAKAILVRLGTASWSLAQAEELGRVLASSREGGRRVFCHADGYDNASMLLAARGCDEIWISPSGTVETVGIAGQLVFGRELLDKLSIDADFLQVGKYKGASEPFTRDSASPEARESLQSTLGEMREAWAMGIADARNAEVAELGIEDGPLTAGEAIANHLVDREGYEQEAMEAAQASLGDPNRVVYHGRRDAQPTALAEIVRLLAGSRPHAEPYVAVVPTTGAITMDGGSLLEGGGGISARALTRVLRRLAEDEMAVAVVLRIDSPGGSALGSDLLWKELMELRKRKPVVASIGAMAASGGCYLAAAASKIFAERTSIVGSIGVVAGKFSFGRSLEQIGIRVETVEAHEGTGARAAYASALTPWDERTRARVAVAVEATYDLFVRRVAEGRGKPLEIIEMAAEGRIYGGDGGRERGLVDEIGGLDAAIDAALGLAGLPPDAPVDLVAEPSGLEQLFGAEQGDSARHAAAIESRAVSAAFRATLGGMEPYRAQVAAFVGTMTPLAAGERLLATAPYVLVVR